MRIMTATWQIKTLSQESKFIWLEYLSSNSKYVPIQATISGHKLPAAVMNSYEDWPAVHAVANAYMNDVPMATDSTELSQKMTTCMQSDAPNP